MEQTTMDQTYKTIEEMTDSLTKRDMHNVRIGFTLAACLMRLCTALGESEGKEEADLLMNQILSGNVVDTKENMKGYQRLLVKLAADVLEQVDLTQRSN